MSNSGRLIAVSVVVIVIFIVIPLIIAGVSLLIYKGAYKRKLNKRLAEGMEANIKPMMTPGKFIALTVCIVIASITALWWAALAFFNLKTNKQKREMAVYPTAFELNDEGLRNSPFGGYKFGDEIKGYERFHMEYGDLKVELYILNNTLSSVLPNILVAADYAGDKDEVVVRQKADFGVSQSNWSYIGLSSDQLTVIDVGGYRGEFTYVFEVYTDMDEKLGLTLTDNDYISKRWEYMDSNDADTSCNIDFKAEELFGRGAGISSPQLGIMFYFD